MSPTKLVGTVIGAFFTIWYTYSRILQIPEKKIRLALLPIAVVGGLWLGISYGFSDRKLSYVDDEMSEVTRGYPFALERHAHWYDGSSEDDVSPFPFGVRMMNFAYGMLVFHFFATLAMFLTPVHELTIEEIKQKLEKLKKKQPGNSGPPDHDGPDQEDPDHHDEPPA